MTTGTTAATVTRWVITHVDAQGQRTLADPAQGRYTYPDAHAARKVLDSLLQNTPVVDGKLAGVLGLPLEVRPVECYAGHYDPKTVWFPYSREVDIARHALAAFVAALDVDVKPELAAAYISDGLDILDPDFADDADPENEQYEARYEAFDGLRSAMSQLVMELRHGSTRL